jgi:hypothetical protein
MIALRTTLTTDSLVQSRAYSRRMDMYRKRIWKCQLTGRQNLTFEEALISERTENARLEQSFPQEYLPLLINLLHQSTRLPPRI